MHAALPLELRVNAVAFDDGDDFLVSAHTRFRQRHHVHFPAMLLGETRIHAEDFGREERGFIAAGAGADFEDHVLLVIGILGNAAES